MTERAGLRLSKGAFILDDSKEGVGRKGGEEDKEGLLTWESGVSRRSVSIVSREKTLGKNKRGGGGVP